MEKFDFKPFDKVLVRDDDDNVWKCDMFSHFINHGLAQYVCTGGWYKQCIPYEGNESLLGTSDDYKSKEEPKYEPKDGDFIHLTGDGMEFVAIFDNDIDNHPPCYINIMTYSRVGNRRTKVERHYNHYPQYYAIRPATGEEKQQLLDAMREIGKGWDAEKKEIVDLKYKPKNYTFFYYVTSCMDVMRMEWSDDDVICKNLYAVGNCFEYELEAHCYKDQFEKILKGK